MKTETQIEKEKTEHKNILILCVIALVYLVLFMIDQALINFIPKQVNVCGMIYISFIILFVLPYNPGEEKQESQEMY